ncbi:MAG TPA: FecR domain-containing protein [Polyangiaceae bacterium]|nr:FecR domain-containing protein [Polyangiaceae bacterium]
MSSSAGRRTPLPAAELIQPEWRAERRENALARVRARLDQRARRMRVAAVVSVASALGLVLGFALHARLEPQGLATRDARQIRFGDGSTVQLLDAASVLDVGAASPNAVEVSLRSGSAEFEITPNPKRRFVVHAGIAEISVLGTHFRVTREEPRVRVEVTRGRVAVDFAGNSRQLTAGESSWFPPAESAAEAPSPAASAAALPPAASSPAVSAALPAPSASVDGATPRHRFLDHAKRGEYREAYSVLERAPAVIGNGPEDLMLAADAARFSNHPAQATHFLERVTHEHARDSVAPLAAFTLGRIYLSQVGQPAKAADAFALSRKLAPGGSLAEDALAREVEAAQLAGQASRAHDLAEQYLRRYPNGRRLASVRKSAGLGPTP